MAHGWSGTIEQFLKIEEIRLLDTLCLFVYNQSYSDALNFPDEESTLPQIRAWKNCIKDLKNALVNDTPFEGYIIFEYILPRTGGRRPDVLILTSMELLVLEFKGYSKIDTSEYYQTSLYVRDLSEYHSIVQEYNLNVRGIIVSPQENPKIEPKHEFAIYSISPTLLNEFINKVYCSGNIISDKVFLEGEYHPLPSIIESAHNIYNNEPLPKIKNLQSSNFEDVVKETKLIAKRAKENNTHHLILISGVPGAGKTFVGLTLAHELSNAVYLSGNGPLVDVLQDILKNEVFVKALRVYKYAFKQKEKLNDNILIFDEAQRAWDSKKMNDKYSEPDIMVQIAQKQKWSVIVALVGEGQEIHTGEEGGLKLWNEAIKNKEIQVHSKNNEDIFDNAYKYSQNKSLHLNTSLRTHKALNYYKWVELFLNGDILEAKKIELELQNERFILQKVKSIEEAKLFAKKLYKDTNKTYGLVCSSKNYNTKQIPFSKPRDQVKPHVDYYNNVDSEYYCKNLNYAVTEFHAQGLELDLAIVIWGDDIQWNHDKWIFKNKALNSQAADARTMKINAFRVLLTRGRDGIILVSP